VSSLTLIPLSVRSYVVGNPFPIVLLSSPISSDYIITFSGVVRFDST